MHSDSEVIRAFLVSSRHLHGQVVGVDMAPAVLALIDRLGRALSVLATLMDGSPEPTIATLQEARDVLEPPGVES